MKLEMRKKPDLAQTLPDDDNRIDTGPMHSCVCVIVMWDYYATDRQHAEVRGFHGNGGIQAVNWKSLLDEVPNTADTRVWILCGPGNAPDNSSLRYALAKARKLASQAHFTIYHGVDRAVLDRNGKWIEYHGPCTRMSYQFTTPHRRPKPESGVSGNAKTVDDDWKPRRLDPDLFRQSPQGFDILD